ncbi:hypothetical protein [Celerinatantimonas sp. MCCC 1A17872]|uniref:hypothetical protein n=1 Tax=Celerinatantimonas sp. MCCC 1A17872 TaxID=3177514 RepID=UPI0038C21C42
MEQSSSTNSHQAPQLDRTEKRLSTLEKDKMRLWKMQNDQHVQIDQLTQQLDVLNQAQGKQQQSEQQFNQQNGQLHQELNRLSLTLKRTRRLLYLAVVLLLLVCVSQVDWQPLWQASQHALSLLQARMTS